MDKESHDEDQPPPPEHAEAGREREPRDAAETGFREPLGDNAVERLRRYQSITLPPDARAAFLSAKLPGAAPELLYDTLPPNMRAEHVGGALPLPGTEPSFEADSERERALDAENTGSETPTTTIAETSAPDRHLRGIAIVGAILLAVALLLGWVTISRDREIQDLLKRREPAVRLEAPNEPGPSPATPTLSVTNEESAPPRIVASPPEPPALVARPPSNTNSATAAPHEPKSLANAAPNTPSPPTTHQTLEPPRPVENPVTTTAPPPSPSANPGKKFRLGSR
jgi:hypothetical protein